jgi:hypothetical protein
MESEFWISGLHSQSSKRLVEHEQHYDKNWICDEKILSVKHFLWHFVLNSINIWWSS